MIQANLNNHTQHTLTHTLAKITHYDAWNLIMGTLSGSKVSNSAESKGTQILPVK